jgi:PAS domain S-box-containing protein
MESAVTAATKKLRANVMIADPQLNITYLNESVLSLMRDAEADLRRELPRFRVDTLIGSNIDVFHKNPDHQRRMLANLEAPHAATIRVGKWTFDLFVTPLFEGGKRLGYVVEWENAEARLLNLDYAAQITAISRSLAVIQFKTDGTILDANENFLRAMGYTLEEVRGRHHSIFIDPATKDSAEYKAFWEKLRAGEYQAAQFKRFGKNGKIVWIEGAYNPILDTHGKVAKVVKFASDITAQQELLANLKTLIDRNFGEIDRAIGMSSTEAESATVAASDMSSSVQSVATSAEELASSIGEISQSMARSKAATDEAFDQTVAAGQNTDALSQTARQMSGIVDLIRNVASQINLLALNATIEAARAGEAGRGFAVVAGEVKNLAVQAARATDQISTEITGVQNTSDKVVSALSAIRTAVNTVRDQVTVTASAVEEQSAVTRGMSNTMQNASGAVTTVSANINEISSAVHQVAEAVAKTKQAAAVLVR